jgi:hypothetical protein
MFSYNERDNDHIRKQVNAYKTWFMHVSSLIFDKLSEGGCKILFLFQLRHQAFSIVIKISSILLNTHSL